MKKISVLVVFSIILSIILSGCGASPVKKGTYALGGDASQQSIVIEKKDMLRFVNFGEDYFINTFSIPGTESEDYDEENYKLILSIGRGEPISYTTVAENEQLFIMTKIGDFLEIRLPYDKKTKTITFKAEAYVLV